MRTSLKARRILFGLAIGLLASTVAACAWSASLGAAGGLGVLLLAGGLLVGLGGTQSGCDFDTGPCLSIAEPDAAPNDASQPDAYIGPCLSPPLPDGGADEDAIGPCLDVLPPDADIGPCLTTIPDDASTSALTPPTERPAERRAAALDHFKDRLPADVVARLGNKDGEDRS